MKLKITHILLVLVLLNTSIMYAATSMNTPYNDSLNNVNKAELVTIQERIQEIKNIDKSDLTSTEKKALRHEVKNYKKKANELNKGVYLSVGAIIIIILLLILIL